MTWATSRRDLKNLHKNLQSSEYLPIQMQTGEYDTLEEAVATMRREPGSLNHHVEDPSTGREHLPCGQEGQLHCATETGGFPVTAARAHSYTQKTVAEPSCTMMLDKALPCPRPRISQLCEKAGPGHLKGPFLLGEGRNLSARTHVHTRSCMYTHTHTHTLVFPI